MTQTARTKFEVKESSELNALELECVNTIHESYRKTRRDAALALGEFKKHSSYIVDTGHTEGLELHTVTTTGVVVIANLVKKVIVTYLIAREGQLRRYGITDRALLMLARDHASQGLNLK